MVANRQGVVDDAAILARVSALSLPGMLLCVTLGLSCNRSAVRIQGNQATFDNSQRNNLRSCVWVRWVVFFGEDALVLSLLSLGREEPGYIAPFGVSGDLMTRANYSSEAFDLVGNSLVLAGV